MGPSFRKGVFCAVAVAGLLAMAVSARRLAHLDLSFEWLRLTMLAFTLLCPVLLGLAIGVWGGTRAGAWGGRGVGVTYLGVVGWTWADAGAFPVGFRLEGFETPMFVTVINVAIFLMTMYFMQALGRSGGRLGFRFVGEALPRPGSTDTRDPLPAGASSLHDGRSPDRSVPV
ncbi:MAG: hypothetical protein ACOYXR_08295 [Nitrospirota bacterium]